MPCFQYFLQGSACWVILLGYFLLFFTHALGHSINDGLFYLFIYFLPRCWVIFNVSEPPHLPTQRLVNVTQCWVVCAKPVKTGT